MPRSLSERAPLAVGHDERRLHLALHGERLGQRRQLGRLARRVGEPGEDAAQQARRALGALDVAAEPEEVVGDAARQLGAAARQLDRRAGRAQQA